MALFMLNGMTVNAAFRRTLSNIEVSEHPQELLSGGELRIMDDFSSYELWVILRAIGTSEKCWSPKYILCFNTFLELSYSKIMPAILS